MPPPYLGSLKSEVHFTKSVLTSHSAPPLPPALPPSLRVFPVGRIYRSFAFQGTNAHAIVSARGGVCPEYDSAVARVPFRSRHWFAPESHPLLRSAAAVGDGAALLEIRVASIASNLFDHRVLGRALFPGAGYLEAVLAASRSLLGDGEPPLLFAATAASIPVPMFLPELDPGLGGLSEAAATLHFRADHFEAATLSATGHRMVHALGSVGPVCLPVKPTEDLPSPAAESTATEGSRNWCCIADGKTGGPCFTAHTLFSIFHHVDYLNLSPPLYRNVLFQNGSTTGTWRLATS